MVDATEDLMVLDRNGLGRLTKTWLRILDAVRQFGEVNVKDLTAHLKRDAKNVSRDVAYLESFGLLEPTATAATSTFTWPATRS